MVALRLYADGMLMQNKVALLALQRTGVSKQLSKNKLFVVYMHYIFSCQKSEGKKQTKRTMKMQNLFPTNRPVRERGEEEREWERKGKT